MNDYVIMWTYEDEVGHLSGALEMRASSRKTAEEKFYKLNRKLVIGIEHGEPIFNPEGGYVCECVLTYKEWVSEGRPTEI